MQADYSQVRRVATAHPPSVTVYPPRSPWPDPRQPGVTNFIAPGGPLARRPLAPEMLHAIVSVPLDYAIEFEITPDATSFVGPPPRDPTPEESVPGPEDITCIRGILLNQVSMER